ncbi:MAG: hypothetical protein SCH70_12185 [Candidatus Methanoperedens sp.]|nr:hypothetical protein [Candidatus Methanoperedens sp.]
MLNHAALGGTYQNLKFVGFKKTIPLIFIALLVLTTGCVSIPEKQSTPTPTTTPILT